MSIKSSRSHRLVGLTALCLFLLTVVVNCSGTAESVEPGHTMGVDEEESHHEHHAEDEGMQLQLPSVEPAELEDGTLKVVATTSIIGDVVARVGGKAIQLTTLMASGQDPHTYDPSARALTAVAEADVIFIHGWNLEEGLDNDLTNVAEKAVIVPVAAHLEPIRIDSSDEAGDPHEHGSVDPHTWLDPHLVLQWTDNIARVLSARDPSQAGIFDQNARAYKEELSKLITYYDEQIAKIPPAQRVIVTNHDSLAYFARAYDFEVIGTVIPGASTLAEPSAIRLTTLIQTMERAGVCTIFAETMVRSELAQTVSEELSTCDHFQILSLYTDAVGPEGSGAESYIGMMRANIDTLLQGLSG